MARRVSGERDGHSSGTPVARRVVQPTRMTGPDRAEDFASRHSYSVLLPVGFAVPPPLPAARCALTAPFHPYRGRNATQPRRSVLCGTVPETSRKTSRRTLSGTVGPWSPDFPPRPPFGIGAGRPSGRLTGIGMGAGGACVKCRRQTSLRKAWGRPPRSWRRRKLKRLRPRLQKRAQREQRGGVGNAVDARLSEMALERGHHRARVLVIDPAVGQPVAVTMQRLL